MKEKTFFVVFEGLSFGKKNNKTKQKIDKK